MRNLPKLAGISETVDEYYAAAAAGRILRMGVQLDTPSCNWRCPYCYAEDKPIVGAAPLDALKDWITQGRELGAKAITINGTYEPTTAKHLIPILEYAHDLELTTTLVSNGTCLTDSLAARLNELEVSVLLKLNVPMAEESDPLYDTYAGIQSKLAGKNDRKDHTYARILRRLTTLIRMGFNRNDSSDGDPTTRLGIESVITSLNISHLRLLARQLRRLNIYSHFEVVKIQGFCGSNAWLAPSKESLKELFHQVLLDDIEDGYSEWDPKPPYIGGTCFQNLIRINIAASGEVKPCPGIDIRVGDLKKTSMKEILSAPIFQRLRNLEEYIQGDCKECDLFKQRKCFAGCRGTAFQELTREGYAPETAIIASDPGCWRVRRVADKETVSTIVAEKALAERVAV